MNNEHSFYPYQQNIKIIKSLFAKPITLIVTIAFAVKAVLSLFTAGTAFHILFSFRFNGNSVQFDPFSIIMSVAFFLLYFKSKNNESFTSYKSPVVLLKIFAVANIFIISLILIGAGCIGIFYIAFPQYFDLLIKPFLPYIFAFAIPVFIITLIYSVFIFIFANSVKKSVSSVFIYKKGALGLGITAIILFALSIVSSVISFIFYPAIIQQAADSLATFIQYYGTAETYGALFELHRALSNVNLNASALEFLDINTALYIILAIFAFSYRKDINKHTAVIKSNSQPLPESELNISLDESPSQTINNAQPLNFEPQNVHFDQNPYLQSEANTDRTMHHPAPICPNCGFQCNLNAQFCSNCGTKLK